MRALDRQRHDTPGPSNAPPSPSAAWPDQRVPTAQQVKPDMVAVPPIQSGHGTEEADACRSSHVHRTRRRAMAGTADTENPIGPLPTDPAHKRLGSPDRARRDDILMRNGCVGTATAPWDPARPVCMKYTGCPAAFPVVWCALPGVGHNNSSYNGVSYSPGGMWKFLSALPEP
jgi:poly(3-hydroxybutyrate) depolymerase